MAYNQIPPLAKLVSKLDTTCGYSGRYTLIQRVTTSYQSWAIMKKEGQLDRNVSGWATPLQLRFWVLGHLEGYSAHERRSPTGRLTEKQPELSRTFGIDPEMVREHFETPGTFDPKSLGDIHGTKIP